MASLRLKLQCLAGWILLVLPGNWGLNAARKVDVMSRCPAENDSGPTCLRGNPKAAATTTIRHRVLYQYNNWVEIRCIYLWTLKHEEKCSFRRNSSLGLWCLISYEVIQRQDRQTAAASRPQGQGERALISQLTQPNGKLQFFGYQLEFECRDNKVTPLLLHSMRRTSMWKFNAIKVSTI